MLIQRTAPNYTFLKLIYFSYFYIYILISKPNETEENVCLGLVPA